MQSTVVKHKKDGGSSGGVFDSYNIIRVRFYAVSQALVCPVTQFASSPFIKW